MLKMIRKGSMLFAALLPLLPAVATAQEDGPSTHSTFSFRPKPASECDWFPITQFGVAVSAAHPTDAGFEIWNLGLLHPLGDRFALGATVAITHGDWTTVTLAPVGRVYLTRSIALDVAPGVLIHGSTLHYFPTEQPSPDVMIQSWASGETPGFALDASLSFGDWVGVFVRTTVYPYSQVSRSTLTLITLPGGEPSWLSGPPEIVPQDGVITEHWIGLRAGSYPGLGLGVLAVAATIVVEAMFADEN